MPSLRPEEPDGFFMLEPIAPIYPCYNPCMSLADDLKAYQARWNAVEAVQREERPSASLAIATGSN